MNDEREFSWDDEILDEGGSFEPFPEGDYDFTVNKVERSRSSGKGKLPACNMAKVTFTVWGAENSREITENFILHSTMEWKLSQLFLSVGMKKHGEPLRMNWTAIVGKTGKCRVGIKTFKKNDGSDGTSNEIKKFYAYDEDVRTVSAKPQYQQYSQPVQNTYNAPSNGGWTPGAF
ncbi:MAG: hypothetical protein U0L58_10590 [Ruminococcus sp.]|nr:hypothetical protein [Ruminococcus sp.]